jgi:hypothetical protein
MRKIFLFLLLVSCINSLYALVSPAEPVFRGYLRQGSAQGILCGPFIDDTDLKTIVDDATITDTALLVVKTDGTSDEDTELQTSSGGDSTVNTWNTVDFASFTDDSFGILGLTATNTSTLGNLIVQLYDTGADNWVLPPYLFIVLPPLAYDLQYGGIVDVSLVNRVAPFNNTTDYVIPVPFVAGTVATYTSTTSITLDASAAATANLYKGHMIEFPSGTGANQSAIITAYTSGRVATLAPALNVALDTTTTYRIYPGTLNVGTVVLETPFDNSTDTVQLANDTITSAKFDESTAYPLKSADTGSTAVARTGADSDTLKTLSDQMDATDTAAEIAAAVWNAPTASYTTDDTFGDFVGSGIPAAVWGEPMAGYITSGDAGWYLGQNAIPGPPGPSSDFGPNAANAVLERAGSTSTTTTIYLTTNTVDSIYSTGTRIIFADSSGLYHEGVIQSNDSDVLSLYTAAGAAPADQTPIYPIGIGYSTLAKSLTNADIDSSFVNAISGDTIDDLIFRQPYAYYESIPKDSIGYMWLFPQWAATLAGIDRLDSTTEDVSNASTSQILYFIPTPSSDRLLWTKGRGVLVEVTTGDYTTYAEGIVSTTSYNEGSGVLTVTLVSSLTATPKDQGNIYLRKGNLTGDVTGTVDTVTNLTNAPTAGDLTATMKASVTAAVPTAAANADAVWDEISTGHIDAGKAGQQIWTDVDAILEDTGQTLNGQLTSLASSVDAVDNFVDTEIALIISELAKVPKSDSTVSWNATALEAIATAVLGKALTEPTAGASPDLPTLDQALSWLYSRWFNKSITTSTEYILYKRDETTKLHEQDVSDDGTNLTVGEAKAAD